MTGVATTTTLTHRLGHGSVTITADFGRLNAPDGFAITAETFARRLINTAQAEEHDFYLPPRCSIDDGEWSHSFSDVLELGRWGMVAFDGSLSFERRIDASEQVTLLKLHAAKTSRWLVTQLKSAGDLLVT